ENILERAIILSKTEEIEIKIEKEEELDENNIKSLEKKAIIEALKKTGSNKKLAAQLLGISLRTLYNKIKEFGLE
ncbi:MAG: helix-turn-helix domain-containing protein, partial [Thermodesulfovibrio sp.]